MNSVARQQSVVELKAKVRTLESRLVVKEQRQEVECQGSDTQDFRKDIQQAIKDEREARLSESVEILSVVEALREALARTNAAVEEAAHPDYLFRILAKSEEM